jgi:hypothetical protein
MKNIYLFFVSGVAILFFGLTCPYAAPYISSSSGTASDGQKMIIGGSGFGTNPLSKIEWLGGPDGNIEKGVTGQDFKKDGWSNNTSNPVKYSEIQIHSGLKSILSQWPSSSRSSGYFYDTGISGVGKIYVTWWAYFDHVDSAGQWKKWRLRYDSNVNDTDGEVYENNWYSVTGSGSSSQFYVYCDLENYISCYPNSDSTYKSIEVQPVDQWVRIELYAEESSANGIRDGSIQLYRHPQTSVISKIKDFDGTVITRATNVTNRWRYFIFQNYWGNNSGGTGTKEKVYIDDIFIQVGTQARVEVGDNSTWENCKHREIQMPVSWDSSKIEFTFNRGSFKGGVVYLYVVDEKGNVSDYDPATTGAQGYPITVGSTADVILPGAPVLSVE